MLLPTQAPLAAPATQGNSFPGSAVGLALATARILVPQGAAVPFPLAGVVAYRRPGAERLGELARSRPVLLLHGA